MREAGRLRAWSRPDAELTVDVTRVSASWSSDVNAFGADGIGFYFQVYRATPGRGVSGPLSIRPESQSRSASSLWVSDDDLAGMLDRMDGTSFYWWHGAFAAVQKTQGSSTKCQGLGGCIARTLCSRTSTQRPIPRHPGERRAPVSRRTRIPRSPRHPHQRRRPQGAGRRDRQQRRTGDMLLEALAACAGVTLNAAATGLGISLRGALVEVEGDLDFRGALGMSKDVPIGFETIRIEFELDTDASDEQLAMLLQRTDMFCVVYQTLARPPAFAITRRRVDG